MKRIILIGVISAITSYSFGQIGDTLLGKNPGEYYIIDKMPVFPGGIENLYKIIEDSLIYPELAIKDKIGGKVIVQFLVDTTGNVKDIRILEGIRKDIDQEALRLVGLLNGWTPAIQQGKKVIIQYSIPLTFDPNQKARRKRRSQGRK